LPADEVQTSLPRSDYSAWVLQVAATLSDLTATVERRSQLVFPTSCFLTIEVEDVSTKKGTISELGIAEK
jgi:hypothetical protein